ncbi:hypothetical protein LCGC14_2828270 [marine sediment metagenome]|uniref:Cytidyltransferase-like domain-containing protein n=1 Tax=marine sediment metagenome TaxID=412755 RepID=A0A0F8Z1P0_9ZZZZ
MKTVMISGYFDPFHYAHLEYIKKASKLGDNLVCVVSDDKQARMKKGKANEPADKRAEIIDLILMGLGVQHTVYVNTIDETTYVAKVLRQIFPDIFCRGSDKAIEDMPPDEREACEELDIEIVHLDGVQAHGSDFV